MRITTSTFYDINIQNMQDQTQSLNKVQQQMATGLRMQTPKDDPVAATQVLQINQASAQNSQYMSNVDSARSLLNMQQTALNNVVGLIQTVQQTVVQAGDGILNDSDRATLATEVQENLQSLVTLANSPDDNGGYLFSGYQSSQPPFAQTPAGVTYQGDQGPRQVQISASRTMAAADNGDSIFNRIPDGSGSFTVSGAAGNTGSGSIAVSGVADASDPNIDTPLTIKFMTPTSYEVIDGNTGQPIVDKTQSNWISGSNTYSFTPNQAQTVTFYGKSFTLGGAPSGPTLPSTTNGDAYTVRPVGTQSIFTVLSNLATALKTPTPASGDKTAMNNALAAAGTNLANALTHVLTQQSTVGARLNSLTDTTKMETDLKTQYAQSVSQLQDVDYAKAASELAKYQLSLQAAEQSFAKVQGLSLFNFLNL